MQCVYDEGTKLDFFMSELIHCPSTFMSVSPRPDLLCGQRRPLQNPSPASGRDKRGPPVSSQTPAQPPAATSAALPYLRKTAKIRRFSGGPRLSRPGEGWADARERGPPVFSQNPSPASGRDKRGPPVSSQNRKDSPVFWNTTLPYLRKTPAQPPAATSAALPYLRKTAKIRRFSGTRPSHIFEKPQRFVGFREGRVCRGREGGGRTRGSASLPGAASGG